MSLAMGSGEVGGGLIKEEEGEVGRMGEIYFLLHSPYIL
jgi:hypothetical protein